MGSPENNAPVTSNDQSGDQKLKNFQLQEIGPSDLEELARFINHVAGSNAALAHTPQRLPWILLENPARVPGDPLGWLVRSSTSEIVGCMCCAPQKFCFEGKAFTLMMASSFYVDDRYRGAGASIFLKYFQLARRYALFVSSANPEVAQMWEKLGGYSLGNSDREMFAILNWAPVLEESVYRKAKSASLARFAGYVGSPRDRWFRANLSRDRGQDLTQHSAGTLVPLTNPEDAANICAQNRSDQLTNCRGTAFLRWRYFSKADSTTRVFAFRPLDSDKKAYMVAVRMQTRGYKHQIRALQVLDIWGEPDAKTCTAIAACLGSHYRDEIDILAFRCLKAAQQQALSANGFRVRHFAEPIAWCIDKHGLLPTKNWYFVPADGDMFL